MVPWAAICIDGTFAGIHTLLLSARKCGVAVGVNQTLVGPAAHFRIALGVGEAIAPGSVLPRFADCIFPTGLEETRILALFPNAGLVISAF